jgi:rare lipoprotein A
MRARTGLIAIISCCIMIFGLITGCTPGTSQVRNNRGHNADKSPAESSYESNAFGEESSEFGNEDSNSDIRNDNKSNSGRNTQQRNRNERDDQRYNVRSSEKDDRSSGDEERLSGMKDRNYEERSYTQKEYYQTGMASWYGREFHGRVTASGERFNMDGLSAAHKQLPFGTTLEVTNFDNGRTVRVKVNDRGPYRGKRIMDLSYGAARRLGMVSSGKAMVGIRILRKDHANNTDAGEERYNGRRSRFVEPVVRSDYNAREDYSRNRGNYSVQAGAFYSRRNAEKLKSRIEALTRNSVVIVNDGDLYKVRVKGINSKSEAGRFKRTLADENIESFVMEKE